jgi:ketosteroid isomerase-like protein
MHALPLWTGFPVKKGRSSFVGMHPRTSAGPGTGKMRSVGKEGKMANIAEIAHGLVDLCRKKKYMEAVEAYYSDNIVSVESATPPGGSPERHGIQAVKDATKWWLENHEIHSERVNGPFVGDKQFAVEFEFDVTNKPTGKRMKLQEMALYTVEGGKVVHEHFFYKTS